MAAAVLTCSTAPLRRTGSECSGTVSRWTTQPLGCFSRTASSKTAGSMRPSTPRKDLVPVCGLGRQWAEPWCTAAKTSRGRTAFPRTTSVSISRSCSPRTGSSPRRRGQRASHNRTGAPGGSSRQDWWPRSAGRSSTIWSSATTSLSAARTGCSGATRASSSSREGARLGQQPLLPKLIDDRRLVNPDGLADVDVRQCLADVERLRPPDGEHLLVLC